MDASSASNDLQELKKLVHNHQCLAFIGAGVSPYGDKQADKWKWLVMEVAKKCDVLCESADLSTDIVDKCLDKSVEKCNSALRELLPHFSGMTREAINYIHNLKFPAILTTNIDLSAHRISRSEQYGQAFKYPDLPLFGAKEATVNNGIFYLHGIFNSEDSNASVEDLVLGSRSFREAYENSLLPSFLTQVFVYRSVLFIGFNPREKYIARILKQSADIQAGLAGKLQKTVPRHFLLWPTGSGQNTIDQEQEKTALDEMRSIGITPIVYPAGKNYIGLDKLLESWVREGDLKNRPAPFVQQGI